MTSISNPAREFGGALDLGVAALAAGSIGFLAFAMPDDLFSSLVGATHLSDLVAAAAPPLGMKARYAVIAAGTGLAFLLVWGLLRALDGVAAASSARPTRREADPDAPRLRRADAHPDAPARRPLVAGLELGEPEIDDRDLDMPPRFAAFASEPEFDAPEPAPAPAPEPEPVRGRLPRFMVPETPEPAAERNPVVPPEQKRSFDPLAPHPGEAETPASDDSIGKLMQRLERGLADREEPQVDPDLPPVLAQASANPEASLSPEGVRHRLRSAISDLNQMGGRA